MKYFILIFIISNFAGTLSSTSEECTVSGRVCLDEEACEQGYFLSSDNSKCLPYVTEYNEACSEDAQCEWIGENSVCEYVCTCKEGFRWYQGGCKKYVGLGEKCSSNLDCFDGYNLLSLTCTSGTCDCTDGYYRRGDADCRKIASNINDTCALDIDCQFPNATCHLGKCTTSSTETLSLEEEIEQAAFLYQGRLDTQSCANSDDCSEIPNSECYDKTGTCICQKQYFFNKEGTECVPELGVNITCESSDDCKIRPGQCIDGVCYCRDYYFVDDGNRNCVKTISQNNWNCVSREWCYALGKYSFCGSSGTCSCSKLAEFDGDDVLCEWNGQEDPDICTTDANCGYIEGYCVDEECVCQDYEPPFNRSCLPYVGHKCQNITDCPIENTECRNNTCECVAKYVSTHTACYIQSNQLGDECEVEVQCSSTVENAKCIGGICGCDDNYLPYDNNSCYERKEYTSYCNNLFECELSLGETYSCRNRMCQCPTGYSLHGDECSSSSIKSGSLIVVLFALVLKGALSVFG